MSNQPDQRDSFFRRTTNEPVEQIADAMHGWVGMVVAVLFIVVAVLLIVQVVFSWITDLF